MTLYNELVAHHPDALPVLKQGAPWFRQGEHGFDERITPFSVPIFSVADGQVSCRYNRGWQERPDEGIAVSDEHHRAFDIIDKVAGDIKYEFEFKRGDIQLVSNLTAFHGRDAHAPAETAGTERWLMRTWLYLPDFRPVVDPAINRLGILRHGNLGLTAAELAHALSSGPSGLQPGPDVTLDFLQPRRPDGAPLRTIVIPPHTSSL
jgi:hypothetical protein